jgi:WD40-like Beta Propeller Repeat
MKAFMRRFNFLTVSFLSLLSVAGIALADATVDQQSLGPDGQLFGGSVSPKGEHIAVFAGKGSHYEIIMDGVEGPKIDNLIFNISGALYRAESGWVNMPIPVIFSKDGAHWAYMAKQGDEYVVMLDGKEFARGPINPRNLASSLNLTFSANGQHIFWSDGDAQGNYVIVVDGKPGPAMRTVPQLVLSPDGNHYAYINYNRDGTGAWAFVDGKQVNFFGDNLQYTARNVLVSTMHTPDNNNVFVLNGKPSIKALGLTPMWISDDGKQIAMIITPQQGAQAFLTVDGKQVAGTEGVPVEKVYFSPDGKHYAALCRTKTGAKYMIIDGKKGDEYPSIAPQVANDSGNHWRYVTWTQNNASFGDMNPPVPGFTADSSKFVYVANSNGRQFLVINADESNAFGDTLMPVLSPVGNRIGAYGVTPDHIQHILMDGKDTAYGVGQSINQLTFSPQGTHYVFIVQNFTVYLDNVAQPGMMQENYGFSPDDKHIAYAANYNGQVGLVVDGKLICDKAGVVRHIFFSPDSKHIYWVSTGNLAMLGVPNTKDSILLYVDGKPATHYSDNGTLLDPLTDTSLSLHPEFSADDVMTFIARTDGNLRRFHVKSDTDFDTLLAAAPAFKAK